MNNTEAETVDVTPFDEWLSRYVGMQDASHMRFSVDELQNAFESGRATRTSQPSSALREAAFLTALAEAGIEPDIQELLVAGNPVRGIAPGALRKALNAVTQPEHPDVAASVPQGDGLRGLSEAIRQAKATAVEKYGVAWSRLEEISKFELVLGHLALNANTTPDSGQAAVDGHRAPCEGSVADNRQAVHGMQWCLYSGRYCYQAPSGKCRGGHFAASPTPSDTDSVREAQYLVWSNEHQAWWGKDRCGYTRHIERAGRYERAEALLIAGTRDGGWHVGKGNPDEIAIPERDAVDQYAAITAALAKLTEEAKP